MTVSPGPMATGGSCGQTPSGCRRQCRSGESTAKSSSSSSSIASISISHLTRGRALWTSHTHGLGRVDRVQVRVGSGGDPGETLDSGRTRGRRACISRSAAQVTIGRASSIRASVGGGRRRVVIVLSGARAEDSSDDGTDLGSTIRLARCAFLTSPSPQKCNGAEADTQ